jgi:hypothetical protein
MMGYDGLTELSIPLSGGTSNATWLEALQANNHIKTIAFDFEGAEECN